MGSCRHGRELDARALPVDWAVEIGWILIGGAAGTGAGRWWRYGGGEHGEDSGIGSVGAGGQQMPGRGYQQGERGQVDAPPQPVGEAAAGQRGGLDRDQQVDGHHPPGDRPGPPGGRQRHQQVQRVEVDVAVQQQGGEVDAGEGQSQPAEVAMQVQGPSGGGPAAE